MELVNVCMECGHEWEDNNAISCPKCNSGNFNTETEYYYNDISLEDCFVLYHAFKKECICNADMKLVNVMEA